MAMQVLFLQLPVKEVSRMLAGTLVAALGLFLFLLGVGIAFLPFGRIAGEALGALPQKWLLVAAGMLLGYVTAWAEPAGRPRRKDDRCRRWGVVVRNAGRVPGVRAWCP